MKTLKTIGLLFLITVLSVVACKKDDDTVEPSTGTLFGVVSELSTDQAIEGVRIIVYNSDTDSPTGNTYSTDAGGNFRIELEPGNYYLKLGKQGYENNPVAGISPVSVGVSAGNETESNYKMQASSINNGGYITGNITSDGNAVAGALVVVSSGSNAFSSVSDVNGTYYIYNIPSGSYTVTAFIAEYTSSQVSVSVSENAESKTDDISLTAGASGQVSGTVTFLATENGEVDVTLTHPITKETIPGLVANTINGSYTITGVPNGTYIARASFKNDSYVVDPDWIVKNGEPVVSISGNSVSRDFSVTGAVGLISPSNSTDEATPIEINTNNPEFSWQAYSSVSDYVIEVTDINGNLIWGGFTVDGSTISKNVSIPKSATSVTFNSDGSANSDLNAGIIYRWRIYASKDDSKDANGWILISVSEEQKGLFIIK